MSEHRGARHATLEVAHVPGLLRLRVGDGGCVDEHGGGGLGGLAGRVGTGRARHGMILLPRKTLRRAVGRAETNCLRSGLAWNCCNRSTQAEEGATR